MILRMDSGTLRAGAVVLAFLSPVLAQTDDPDCDGFGPPVQFRGTWDGLSQCETISGDLEIIWTDTQTIQDASSFPVPTSIAFPYLNRILGDVTFTDSRSEPDTPIQIEAESLDDVAGTVTFNGMPNMAMPMMGNLKSVRSIVFNDVTFSGESSFGGATFGTLSVAQNMTFMNTSLTDIGDGWTTGFTMPPLGTDEADFSFIALDNPNLSSITIPGYDGIDGNLRIEGNSEELSVDFPQMTKCSLNLQGVKSFSAGSLVQIGSDDDIEFGGSTSAAGVKVSRRQDASVTIVEHEGIGTISNNYFEELRLPNLTTIVGPFKIADNSALTTVSFPLPLNIHGEVEIIGDAIETFEISSDISFHEGGQLDVESSNPQLCSTIQVDNPNFTCQQIKNDTPSGSASSQDGDSQNPDDSNDGNSQPEAQPAGANGSLSTAAKAGLGVGLGLGIPLILLLAFCLYRRRSRRTHTSPSSRTARSMGGTEGYGKEAPLSETPTSPTRYSKVPSEMRTEDLGGRPVSALSYTANTNTHGAGHGRVPSDEREYIGSRGAPRQAQRDNAVELEEQQGERFEMEEQQGFRHEMDARSLPDIDLDDDGADRRSLEDIERSRNSGPPPMGVPSQHGPVSPVG